MKAVSNLCGQFKRIQETLPSALNIRFRSSASWSVTTFKVSQTRNLLAHMCRWLWKPKWREPPLLLAPISPNGRPDDMRMSLTIGMPSDCLATQVFCNVSSLHFSIQGMNGVCSWFSAKQVLTQA